MKLLAATLALWASLAAGAAAHQTLFFDAVPTAVRGASAHGVLRDASGHAVGRFAYACRRLDAGRQRCSEWGQTAQGRIRVAGLVRTTDATHRWTVASATGAYRGARGSVVARDLDGGEALITVAIAPRAGVVLRAGLLELPEGNAAFRRRADALCASASRQLAALPPFPFASFDPLHPDPVLLPQVGQFFTGPHDPRPALRALGAQLAALGAPPADARGWQRVLAARAASLAVNEEQDTAALGGDVPGFVRSVHDASRAFRAVAISATVFGTGACVL